MYPATLQVRRPHSPNRLWKALGTLACPLPAKRAGLHTWRGVLLPGNTRFRRYPAALLISPPKRPLDYPLRAADVNGQQFPMRDSPVDGHGREQRGGQRARKEALQEAGAAVGCGDERQGPRGREVGQAEGLEGRRTHKNEGDGTVRASGRKVRLRSPRSLSCSHAPYSASSRAALNEYPVILHSILCLLASAATAAAMHTPPCTRH